MDRQHYERKRAMRGKISAFYGAEVKQDNGQPAGTLPNKAVVEILEPTGKPAWHVGEWAKVQTEEVSGWVKADQVIYGYGE
jgi:hypothetical protein